MATRKQKDRPISFVLHDTTGNASPVEHKLVIRPEDLVVNKQSRMSVNQTLGGAWVDNFGEGIPTINISGHTGWGQGNRPDGFLQFQDLREKCFTQWHELRDKSVRSGHDPDKIKLIFADKLDDITWVVAPQAFLLKRSRSRPLLSMYQISMTWVSSDVKETMDSLSYLSQASKEKLGLDSLAQAISDIDSFAQAMAGQIDSVLGPVQRVIGEFTSLTARVLSSVHGVINSGMTIVNSVYLPLLNIAGNLSRAGANIMRSVQSVYTLPDRLGAMFSRVASAYSNTFCIFQNIFRKRKFIGNYDALYGASNCSSTAGGKPISKYVNENPFPELFPIQTSLIGVTSDATNSIGRLSSIDPVMMPSPVDQLMFDMRSVVSGVRV